MLATCAILDEAHNQTVVFVGVYNDGGDRALAELGKGLQTALAADKIIFDGLSSIAAADGDRTLQADPGNVFHDLFEIAPVASPGIKHPDLLDRNLYYMLLHYRVFTTRHHAASIILTRPAST